MGWYEGVGVFVIPWLDENGRSTGYGNTDELGLIRFTPATNIGQAIEALEKWMMDRASFADISSEADEDGTMQYIVRLAHYKGCENRSLAHAIVDALIQAVEVE